jgi:hypothetical protein
MADYKRIPYPNSGSGYRVVATTDDDPDGRELWQLSGKWKTKPGVKPGEDGKKISIHIKLPPSMVDWLRAQPDGVSPTIEQLVRVASQN